MNIQELLEYGKNNLIGKEEPYRLAKMLLKHVMGKDESYFVIYPEEEVKYQIVKMYQDGIEQLSKGKPIQYITNQQEFMGLPFFVDENVLIPQPDTEILVEEVIKLLSRPGKVLDLCTGSGAIGVSIAKHMPNNKVTLADISEKALEIAKKNAENNKVKEQCTFVKSDMFQNIPEKFDCIVSNPPYIQTDVIATLEQEVQNEPRIALDGGKDGLNFYKIIADNAWKYLKENGALALEIGYDQKEDVLKILEQVKQYKELKCKKDLSGKDRVIVCRLK